MSLRNTQDNNQLAIKKHVNAIHCSNNISLVQRKLFNAFLFHAYHDLPKKAQYEISVKTLCDSIGYDSHDQKKLKNSIMALITTAIEWNVLDKNNKDSSKWQVSSIISSAIIEKGTCKYEFSSVMRELLYMPEMYARVDMSVMSQFKFGYGLALYENCIRFQGLSNTPWLSLDVFRKLMGISDNNYLNFCDFKKRVLDIAIREINKYSHLEVTPEIQRANKKVISIRFKLAYKQDKLFHEEQFSAAGQTELIKIMTNDFGLSSEKIKDILLNYDSGYIREKISLIQNSESFRSGKIRELAAYLIDALKRDYKKSKSSKALISEARKVQLEHEEREKKAHDEKNRRYEKYVGAQIDQYILTLSDYEKTTLYERFEQELSLNQYSYNQYKKHGFKNAGVKAIFNIFMKNNELKINWKILTLDEFV